MARKNMPKVTYKDPFLALLDVDRNRLALGDKSMDREMKRSQFGETMDLNRSKFEEIKAQNEIENANAAARIGLARAAASQKMTPLQKELWRRKNALWDKNNLNKYQPKTTTGKGSGNYQNTAVYKNMDPDAQGRMDQDFAKLKSSGFSGQDASSKVLEGASKSYWFNPFEDTFYYDN